MKKIIVACGSGVATSQNVATRLQMMLQEHGYAHLATVVPVDIKAIDSEIDSADLYVALVPEAKKMNYPIPVFDGIKFLTNVGVEQEFEAIVKALQ